MLKLLKNKVQLKPTLLQHNLAVKSFILCAFYSVMALISFSGAAHADFLPGLTGADVAADVNNIFHNIISSFSNLPTLLSAVAFIGGITFALSGVFKLKTHVENPSQSPINSAVGRIVIGGILVSLPVIYEVMRQMIIGFGDNEYAYDDDFSAVGFLSSLMGLPSTILGDVGITRDINAVMNAIITSISDLPTFITVIGYMLGLYLGVTGLLKLKEHIEDPDRNPLKEATIRLFVGACFITLPSVYTVMVSTIAGGNGDLLGSISGFVDTGGFMNTSYGDSDQEHGCSDDIASIAMDSTGISALMGGGSDGTATLGKAICQFYGHAGLLPAFLVLIAKALGLLFGFMALLKLRDHVLNPQNTPLSQAVMRFIAGGSLLGIDAIMGIIKSTVTPASSEINAMLTDSITEYAITSDGCSFAGEGSLLGGALEIISDPIGAIGGLFGGDSASTNVLSKENNPMAHTVYCAVTDVMGPVHTALNFFTFAAGIAFLVVGLSRFLKGEQDGARAPSSIGTISTFILAGVLLSFSDFLRIMTMSIFTEEATQTKAVLGSTAGLTGDELNSFYGIVSAILKFMIMVGMISFVRGLFIMRGVAEGNNQSSMMAGVTHIIAGTLAINLGPFLNLVQGTLGITNGLTFS